MKRSKMLAKAKLRRPIRHQPADIILVDDDGSSQKFTVPFETHRAYLHWAETGEVPAGLGEEEWLVARRMVEASFGYDAKIHGEVRPGGMT